MNEYSRKLRFEIFLFKLIYKPLIKRSTKHILQGRLLNSDKPESGRWLRDDVRQFLNASWERVEDLLPKASLATIPTFGNRHNVFLAVLTTAAYQTMIDMGQTKSRASILVADIGWKLYALGIGMVSFPFRLVSRDPGKRINRTVQTLLIFPFNAPGRPGYEVKVEKLDDRTLTHWTWCPPQAFVRALVETDGDQGELEAFYESWCLYDWPGADMMADDGKRGHYRRKRTLSQGDDVCDMCWRHKAQNVGGCHA